MDNDEFYKEFIDKEVVIYLKNGYKKFCIIDSFNGVFVKIRFRSGRTELVSYSAIDDIKFNNPAKNLKVEEYGKQQ